LPLHADANVNNGLAKVRTNKRRGDGCDWTNPDDPVAPDDLSPLGGDTEGGDGGNEEESMTGVGVL
jgi:hypothetical protein